VALAGGDDVFVSYARADNGVARGADSPGWVSALAENLNVGPNVCKKRIFIDYQLKPGDHLSDELLRRVEQSRLLVLLLSRNYIESNWCGKELEHFIRTHAGNPEKPGDVYVVELLPFEDLKPVPPIIQTVRKRLIHAKFWYQTAGAGAPLLSGYPTPRDSGSEGAFHYWRVLTALRDAIDDRLRAMRDSEPSVQPAAESRSVPKDAKPEPAVGSLGIVLLANTTEDLEAQRMAIKVALEPEGIVVLPEGDYVELTPPEFDAAIASDLERADLFVQLLSPTVGHKRKGFSAPLPQLQFQHAQAARRPIMQWSELLPTQGSIADAAHAKLFETEFLRVTHREGFKTEIIERLRAEKARRERPLAALPLGHAARPDKTLIFVDDLASVPALTDRLRIIIREQNCNVRSLPRNATLGNDGIDVKELLRVCRAGITIYADPTKYTATYNRLVYFLNQVAENRLELERWGVYLEQGTVASEFGIESDDVVAIDEESFGEFLRGL